jgi:hypothetical protein
MDQGGSFDLRNGGSQGIDQGQTVRRAADIGRSDI